jgi:hypothetical protein
MVKKSIIWIIETIESQGVFDTAIMPTYRRLNMSTIKLFSANLISLGVKATTSEIDASLALAEFHARLKRHGVDRANIKEYRHEFDRVALGYLDTKHKGFSAWLDGAKDSKGTVESPFINTKGACYTKRECEALVRALRKKRVEAFEKSLNGADKTTTERTKRTIFTQDVRALHPRMVAFQKLETPTQYEMDHLRLIKGVIEHAVAHDPQAKAEFNALEAKQAKAIK